MTETIGTTEGSTLTYTKTLSSTPVVANSITVTDGTNSWSQSVGNPGVAATATANTISGFVIGAAVVNGGSGYTSAPAVTITGSGSGTSATATVAGGVVTAITINSAGSGYTGGATISIDPPVIPFRVDYSGGAITATYSSAPASGRTISATYRYGTSGITDALGSSSQQWMALSVDGAIQGTRQRVLAVPYAQYAKTASIANSVRAQEKSWRPSVLHISNNQATTLPMGIYDSGWDSSTTGECVIPPSFKKIKQADLVFTIPWSSNYPSNSSTASFRILKIDPASVEQVIYNHSQTSSSISSGQFTVSLPIDLDLDENFVYKIRLFIKRGATPGGGAHFNDAKVLVLE